MARNGRMSNNAINVALAMLGADVSAKATGVLAEGGQTILADAKARIHSISGKLSASGRLEINKKGTVVKIVFDAVSDPSKYGTHGGGYSYSKIVEFRPGHEHPFLYSAYDAHRDEVKQNVIDAIREAVQANAVP